MQEFVVIADVEMLCIAAVDKAEKEIRGCRNQKEYAAIFARKMAAQFSASGLSPHREIRPGDTILRTVGRELGCSAHSDYRQCLDIVHVQKVCKKLIIGTVGERVDPKSVICIEARVAK